MDFQKLFEGLDVSDPFREGRVPLHAESFDRAVAALVAPAADSVENVSDQMRGFVPLHNLLVARLGD